MQGKKQSAFKMTVITVALGLFLLLGILVYYDNLLTNLQEATCHTMDEVMQQEKYNFTKKLEADRASLKGYVELVASAIGDEESLLQALKGIVVSTGFEDVFFVGLDGEAISDEGAWSNLGDRPYFHSAIAGKTVISEPVKSKIRDAYIIAVATPVQVDGEIVGILVGSFSTENLNELFVTSFNGYGHAYIATNTGELIAQTGGGFALADTDNLLDVLEKADFYKNDSYETVLQNLTEGRGGHAQYRLGGQRWLMHYEKLPVNGWNIFSVVNPQGVEVTATRILRDTILLTSGLCILFILLVLYNFRSKKKFTQVVAKMAFEDQVTGFRSFGKFRIDAEELIRRNTGMNYMLIKMDIENFKIVNQIYSLETGDRVLKAEAEALEAVLDKDLDVFGRIYADEFVILVSYQTVEERQEKRRRFEELFSLRCTELVPFELVRPEGRYKLLKDDANFSQIYEKVNFAHCLAKTSPGKIVDFDGAVQARAIRGKEIEGKMENALHAGEFQIYLQPKYRLHDKKIVGAEALARWIVGGEPVVYPADFIPLFEQNGFITQLDMYLFGKVCEVLRGWMDRGMEPFVISANFSRLHLNNPNFVPELCEIAGRNGVPCSLLEIELTETAMLDNLETLEEVLDQLHKAGFTLSMDDFGSGYSSLGLLKNISVDVIKIDKVFFDQTKNPERSKTVIASMVKMARKLGMHTVAEGVETQAHIDLLSELGCEMVQGYYFSKPMPVEQLEEKIQREILADDGRPS